MEPEFDYIKEAMVTLSPSWHGTNVPYIVFCNAIHDCIESLKRLDMIKKVLFYGRSLPVAPENYNEGKEVHYTCQHLPKWFKNDTNGEFTIHAIIGIATEAGELLEALDKVVAGNHNLDETNVKEETGDLFWYMAALAETMGFTFDEVQRINIAKLRARYNDKFSKDCANNRNLDVEREILEKVA